MASRITIEERNTDEWPADLLDEPTDVLAKRFIDQYKNEYPKFVSRMSDVVFITKDNRHDYLVRCTSQIHQEADNQEQNPKRRRTDDAMVKTETSVTSFYSSQLESFNARLVSISCSRSKSGKYCGKTPEEIRQMWADTGLFVCIVFYNLYIYIPTFFIYFTNKSKAWYAHARRA